MIQQDIVALWRTEAKEALKLAKHAHDDGSYWLSLFHCHLAAEKALKARYVEEHDRDPPQTHELLFIAEKLSGEWGESDIELFDTIGDLVVKARYHDLEWRKEQATMENSEYWIEKTETLLSRLCP